MRGGRRSRCSVRGWSRRSPDETILALEDPEDRDGDGIRGRAARVMDVLPGGERIGRFGWKAQHATLLAFPATPIGMKWASRTICFRTKWRWE